MTDQQIIDTLATKVMGWIKEDEWWTNGNGGKWVGVKGWNPLQNIADAWQVADQLEKDSFDVQIYRGQGFTNVEIIESTHGIELTEYEGSTFQEAICNAALKLFATA